MSHDQATRCAVYLRMSLDATGEERGISRQREDCEKIAKARGWTIVKEYVDNSISASDKRKDRPGYNALSSAYVAGEFTAIICWDLDRLTRQPRQMEDWIDHAEEGSLLLVTANGDADLTTDSGQTNARIRLAIAKGEMSRKSARQKRAALQRAQLGKPPKGARLTGYTTDGAVIPAEAVIVAGLFNRFLAGDSLHGLTAWLNDSGTVTRTGSPWNHSTVRTILTNPRYAGRAVYQGKVTGVAGNWNAVVGDAVFDLVQAKISDPRRRTQVGTDRKYLGSGLYLCGVCDRPLRSHSGGRYRCPEGGHVTRMLASIDRYVLDVLRARLVLPDIAGVLMMPQDDPVAQHATAEIARLRARLVTIESDYDAGLIDGYRFNVAQEKVQVELNTALAQQIRAMAGASAAATLSAPDPVAAFDAASLGEQRAVLNLFMTVRLHPAKRGVKFHEQQETVRIEWRTVSP
ncbi:recombinase family protein [Nakamurella sp. PAMC28650]|uniref:recombinase family protein n=1 Tax=Nakamurella sp. PAMC28650 TaxID=2762325 RepID=UPI00164E81E9|nr:recombinase family protein [Nakamurella sp. PAMC28650]QNK80897.1 recombinase family protein [Nakamurella sp. PAMC28650]